MINSFFANPDSYKISLSMEKIISNFSLNNVDNDQSKAIETVVKNVEDLRKWPICMLKYPPKNNNKEYLLYHELANTFHLLHFFDTKKSTLKYGINNINRTQ
jgi:hypothetical protein